MTDINEERKVVILRDDDKQLHEEKYNNESGKTPKKNICLQKSEWDIILVSSTLRLNYPEIPLESADKP